MKTSKNTLNIFFLMLMAILFTACADVSPMANACVTKSAYGFFGGLWHGLIVPVSFVGSLFFDHVAIYAYNNSGGWYDFGFVIGISSLGGGGAKAHKRYYR